MHYVECVLNLPRGERLFRLLTSLSVIFTLHFFLHLTSPSKPELIIQYFLVLERLGNRDVFL